MRNANGSKGMAGPGVTDTERGPAGGNWSVRTALPSVVAIVMLIIVAACNGGGGGGDGGGDEDAAAVPDGTEEFEVEAANHVSGDVRYSQTPPVGGDHDPAWQNCGSYREPVREENAVHSLEHGAVWITYQPDLDEEAIEALEERARGETHVLVTPFEGLGDPVVLSAWGRQLRVDSANDERIDAFVEAFQRGPQSPEAGASCSGAIGEPQ